MLSREEGRRQKRAIGKEIAREHRRAAKAKLKALRDAIAVARAQRKDAMRVVVQQCRAARVATRERAKEQRRAILAQLAAALRDERLAARDVCSTRKAEARATVRDAIARAEHAYAAERSYQEDLRRIEQGNRLAKLQARQASARERRAESDDEVRANIPAGLVQLFERVKRSIRGNARQSRTEAFLKYAEENPGEALEAIEHDADRRLSAMLAEQRRLSRVVRKRRFTAAELAEVPF